MAFDFEFGPAGLLGMSLLAGAGGQVGGLGEGLLKGVALNEQLADRRAQKQMREQQLAAEMRKQQLAQQLQDYIGSESADARGILARGGTPEMARAYAEAPNMGRAKVSNYKQMRLPGGQVVEVPMNEFGEVGGPSFTPYIDPKVLNLGNRQALLDPAAGEVTKSFDIGIDPGTVYSQQMQNARTAMSEARQDARSARSAGSSPYFQFIPTPQGIAIGNARTGGLELGNISGAPVQRADFDPSLQQTLAAVKAGGKEFGEQQAKDIVALPGSLSIVDEGSRLIDQMIGSKDGKIKQHPGFNQAVGTSSIFKIQDIPGTASHDFKLLINQSTGKQFLQEIEKMRGLGQLTEQEGQRLVDSASRMRTSSSEPAFIDAAREYQGTIEGVKSRLIEKTKKQYTLPSTMQLMGSRQQPAQPTQPRPFNLTPGTKLPGGAIVLGFE